MSLDRLWAGWRSPYLDAGGEGGSGCLFCGLAAADPDEAMVLARGDLAFAVMNAYPYTSGHLMVAPLRHEGSFTGLTPEEVVAVAQLAQRAALAVEAAYHPDGMNLGVNVGAAAGAGVPGHVHLHAVPRWAGDTNFMTSVAEARVLPESLRSSYGRLRAAWPG